MAVAGGGILARLGRISPDSVAFGEILDKTCNYSPALEG
jgi:hypothetical protein